MTNSVQRWGWISRTRLEAAKSVLALLVVLGSGVTRPSAEAQTLTVLYSFTGSSDGGNSYADLVRDAAGTVYGTTYYGGDFNCNHVSGCGVVFKVDTSGTETVVHTFAGSDGAYPVGGLLLNSAGDLYGTTAHGGNLSCDAPIGCGTVFRIDASGTETVLHKFAGGDDGRVLSLRSGDPGQSR
jgi:uncharacterized repeat protein (TIGR03803 family)